MSEGNRTVDRKDLKNQALLEKISQLTTQYENQIADLRVELTFKEYEINELKSSNVEDEVVEDDKSTSEKKSNN